MNLKHTCTTKATIIEEKQIKECQLFEITILPQSPRNSTGTKRSHTAGKIRSKKDNFWQSLLIILDDLIHWKS